MAADFSHLSATTAKMVARYVSDGSIPTDEMLLEAAMRIRPALLSGTFMKALRTELDPAAQRRGRPRKGPSRLVLLLLKLEKLDRPDVPADFLASLRHRLQSGQRFRERDRSEYWHRQLRKQRRNSSIRFFYHDLHARLGNRRNGFLSHPSLEDLRIPDCLTRSERAREMTQEVIRRIYGVSPSVGTIRNIVSLGNSRKFS